MSKIATIAGQVSRPAAEIYEEFFVPALFGPWAQRLAAAAGIAPGDAVLDVACGTGVLARAAAERTGDSGAVTGLDCNDGMLDVARRTTGIAWRHGAAEALPFADAAFDRVVSQFGLMFFGDRTRALTEMWRVLRPGGRLTVAVWDRLDHTPGYCDMVHLLQRMFGDRAAEALRVPFALGDVEVLRRLYTTAGLPEPSVATIIGTARFPSIRAWVHTDVRGWTLGGSIDDAQEQALADEAERRLAHHVAADGAVRFDVPAHIVVADKASAGPLAR